MPGCGPPHLTLEMGNYLERLRLEGKDCIQRRIVIKVFYAHYKVGKPRATSKNIITPVMTSILLLTVQRDVQRTDPGRSTEKCCRVSVYSVCIYVSTQMIL